MYILLGLLMFSVSLDAFMNHMKAGIPPWCADTILSRPKEFWMHDDFHKDLTVEKFFTLLDGLYEKNHTAPRNDARQRIPKKIHQIWLGSALPSKFETMSRTWKTLLPDWEYKLWTDEDIANFGLHNKELYDSAQNYGEKSDIARYEILLREGGLYVDTDTVCIDPAFFEDAHKRYDFYAACEQMHLYTMVSNYLIGAKLNHPLMKSIVDDMADWVKRNQKPKKYEWIDQKKGYVKFAPHLPAIIELNDWIKQVEPWHQQPEGNEIMKTTLRTGPGYLTHSITKYLQKGGRTRDIIFPGNVFTPICPSLHKNPALHLFTSEWADNSWKKKYAPGFVLSQARQCSFNLGSYLQRFE